MMIRRALHSFIFLLLPLFLLGVFLLGTFSSCGAKRALTPVEPAGFITWGREGAITDHTPFSYYWADAKNPRVEAIRAGHHFDLYVAPIRREFLNSETDSPETLEERGEDVANDLHKKLTEAIREASKHSTIVTVVDQPKPGSLTLDIALTKLETGNPLIYAAAFAAPLPGFATSLDALGTAMLAMEAKIYDSDTLEVIVEFADQKIPRLRPIDFSRFTKTYPLFDVTTDWSTEISEAIVTNVAKNEIEGTSDFSLLPW